ncbi:MAG TPA: DUF1223 domain-containing protein [Bryobacteraceae bacterium]|jgi:hypothetical protein|nr:DUF1223 domain-containing protein [Bryobacteraceae bacterium]
MRTSCNLIFVLLFGFLPTTCFGQSRSAVLVELFTSEGCSSCPPADRLLEKLDPQAIVLSEHVDYWNQLGWKDPFSSPLFTARQQAYSRILNVDGVYTPEMVVDGEAEFNGSDSRRAAEAIAKAAQRKKADVRISRIDTGLRIEVEAQPGAADLFLALAEDSAASQVSAGENSGRHLHHVAVVRSIQKIGSVKRGANFSRVLELPRTASTQRVIVFLQQSGPGRISGVAMLSPGKPSALSGRQPSDSPLTLAGEADR